MITITITSQEVTFIREMARRAEIGGRSNIRGDNRAATLSEDQLTGQLAEYAWHRYWIDDVRYWAIGRWFHNQTPHNGDNGHDIPALNLDVKGSLIRTNLPLMSHRLLVRPNERHPGNVYVLGLVRKSDEGATVYLMGWAGDEELPEAEKEGPFAGAHVLLASELHRLPPLVWNWTMN